MPALPKETRGKLIDTWTYAYQGADVSAVGEGDDEDDTPRNQPVKNQRVECRVYVVKEQKALDEPPHLTAGVKFRVECDDPKIIREGTDLELLRTEIFSRCDARFQTKWEKWYLVEVDNHPPYKGLGAGLTFSYRDVERGEAWNGTLLLRDRDFSSRRYEKVIKPWPGEFTDNHGHVIACIKATPENTAALEEFATRVNRLREAMADLLRPEVILDTLRNLNGLALLPAADREQK